MTVGIPAGPEELTSEWLTDVLRATNTIDRACVRSIEARELGGAKGAIGRIAHLHIEYDFDKEGAPHLMFAKFAAVDPEFRAAIVNSYVREIRFYEALAGLVQLRTPRCYYASIEPKTAQFVLLLEDLAPARNGDRAAGCSLPEAELAIREIARFHAAWWEHADLVKMDWLLAMDTTSMQRFQNRYLQSWERFEEKMGPFLPGSILDLGRLFGKHIGEAYSWHNNPPQTLVHFDYQLDNLFFGADGDRAKLAVIDWQFLARGRGVFDVASFLGGNIATELRRAHERELLGVYHGLLVEYGVEGYAFDQCWDDYRLSMLDGLFRMVAAIGGGNLRDEQERAHREIIWPRFCTAILDLDVVELLSHHLLH